MMSFRHLFLLLLSALTIKAAPAQQEQEPRTTYYTFDEKGEPSSAKKAAFRGMLKQYSDTVWEYSYYKINGPLMYVETFRSKKMEKLHGYVAYFDEQGTVDSLGAVYNDVKHGWWKYYNDSLDIIRWIQYDNGKYIGEKSREELAEINRTKYDREKNGATFKGGDKNWFKYIGKEVKIPQQLKSGTTLQVCTMFSVGLDGYTHTFAILKSGNIYCDQEAIRVIRQSPQWRPGRKEEKQLGDFFIQPITFSVQ